MKIKKDYIAILIILAMFAMYLNVTLNSPIVFGDEGYYAYQSQYMADNHIIPKYETFKETDVFHPVLTKAPLFLMIQSFGFLVGGAAGVKFLMPVFAMLTSFMLYIFLKKTVSENAGLGAALLYMITPSLVTYGVLGYVDTLLGLLLVCSLYFGYMSMESNNKKGAILAGIFAGLAVLTKVTAPLILGALFLYYIYRRKDVNWKIFATIVIIALILFAPWIIRNLVLFGNPCYGITDCPAITDTNIITSQYLSDQIAGRTAAGGTETSLMSMGVLNYALFAYGIIALFIAIFGISNAIIEKSKLKILMFLVIISMIPVFVFYSARAEDAARWTLPIVIPFAVLGGIFLSDSYAWIKKKSFLVAIILILIIVSGGFYTLQQKLTSLEQVKAFSPGFFDACDWVKSNTPQDSLLLSVYAQQTAYNCNRRVSTAAPDMPEITLTNDERSYQHLTMHGYDYIFIIAGLISQTAYSEAVPVDFYNYLSTSEHFEKVFDNTATYGANGVIIFKVN